MIDIRCPQCHAMQELEDHFAGLIVACSGCQRTLRIPIVPVAIPVPPPAVEVVECEPVQPRRRRRRRQRVRDNEPRIIDDSEVTESFGEKLSQCLLGLVVLAFCGGVVTFLVWVFYNTLFNKPFGH